MLLQLQAPRVCDGIRLRGQLKRAQKILVGRMLQCALNPPTLNIIEQALAKLSGW
ncbi:MAG: hypothetical protein PVS3B1_27800 [Ktedonobacteraceae bacterium]